MRCPYDCVLLRLCDCGFGSFLPAGKDVAEPADRGDDEVILIYLPTLKLLGYLLLTLGAVGFLGMLIYLIVRSYQQTDFWQTPAASRAC